MEKKALGSEAKASKTVEELEKEIANLKEELNEKAKIPSDFEGRLNYFKQQELNLKRLTGVNALIEELSGMKNKVDENINELDHSDFMVVVAPNGASSYDRANIKISDINVVSGMIDYIMKLLEAKRETLGNWRGRGNLG